MASAETITCSLIRIGDYAGKAMGEKLVTEFQVRKLLDEWLASSPDIGKLGEHGFLRFMSYFFGGLCHTLFDDTNTKIEMRIMSDYCFLRGLDLTFVCHREKKDEPILKHETVGEGPKAVQADEETTPPIPGKTGCENWEGSSGI